MYITDIAYWVVESGANVLANGTDPGIPCDHWSCAADITAKGPVGSPVYCNTIASCVDVLPNVEEIDVVDNVWYTAYSAFLFG